MPRGRCSVEPRGGFEVRHPVHAGRPLAAVVLRHPTDGQVLGRPGRHQQPLQSADGPHIATTGGSVDTLLKLEDLRREAFPGQVLPFIRWPVGRAHDVCTPTGVPTFPLSWSTSAYPRHYPRHSLLGPSHPSPRLGRPRSCGLAACSVIDRTKSGAGVTEKLRSWCSFCAALGSRCPPGCMWVKTGHDFGCRSAEPIPFWVGLTARLAWCG